MARFDGEYASLRQIYAGEFVFSTMLYFLLFWKLFTYSGVKCQKKPKHCLLISTTTISTIHSVLVTFPSIFDFIYYQRWNQPIIDEPRLAGHIWSIAVAYFFADTTAHLTCYIYYDKTVIPRRYDVILHHILASLWWFFVCWPTPIYAWNILSIIPVAEFSTIFLNLQWFGKHFEYQKLERGAQIFFIASWFPIRPTIVFYYGYWLVVYWHDIIQQIPLHAVVYLVIAYALMAPLQIIWTCLIIWKMLRYCSGICIDEAVRSQIIRRTPSSHFHGISINIEMEDIDDKCLVAKDSF